MSSGIGGLSCSFPARPFFARSTANEWRIPHLAAMPLITGQQSPDPAGSATENTID
jgi:hypothetical protein